MTDDPSHPQWPKVIADVNTWTPAGLPGIPARALAEPISVTDWKARGAGETPYTPFTVAQTGSIGVFSMRPYEGYEEWAIAQRMQDKLCGELTKRIDEIARAAIDRAQTRDVFKTHHGSQIRFWEGGTNLLLAWIKWQVKAEGAYMHLDFEIWLRPADSAETRAADRDNPIQSI